VNQPILLAVLVSLGVWGVLTASAYRRWSGVGLLPVVLPYGLLLSAAVGIAMSTRDFALPWTEVQAQLEIEPETPALALLIGRLVTGLLLVAAAEGIVSGVRLRWPLSGTRTALLLAFVGFWLTNVASPALFGAYGSFQHDFSYTLALGIGVALLSPREADLLLRSSRNGIVLLLSASFVFVAFRPGLVLDTGYVGGFLPGVPRFAGLMPHPVMLGALCLVGIIVLWAVPFRSRGLTGCAAVVLGGGLIMAQSKLAWAGIALCCLPLVAFGAPLGVRRADGARLGRVATALVTGAGSVALLLLVVSFLSPGMGGLGNESVVGGLTTLTGRTQIWDIAFEEWSRHPFFGYGSDLFGPDYRYAIGLEHMTSGHNQIVDSLARAGVVGLCGVVVYLGLLTWAALAATRVTAGLSVALLCALFLRALTEVPLQSAGYGPENLLPFMLLAVVVGPWRSARPETLQQDGPAPERVPIADGPGFHRDRY
jgi:O-antigen ligase